MPEKLDQSGVIDWLDWGEVHHTEMERFRTYDVERSGNRLFLIRNGVVVLPNADITPRCFQPRCSAWGYINQNSIKFDVGVKRVLTSADAVPFFTILHLIVRLSDGAAALEGVAKRHNDLEQRIRHCAEIATGQVFSEINYRNILLADTVTQRAVEAAVRQSISTKTPYTVEACSFSIESELDAIDDSIRAATAVSVADEERKRTDDLVDAQLVRERRKRESQQEAEIELSKKLADADRAEKEAEAKSRIELDDQAAERQQLRHDKAEKQRLRQLKNRIALSGNPLDVIAVEHPELYIKLLMEQAKLAAGVDVAKYNKDFYRGHAQGMLTGLHSALNNQNLSTADILKIVNVKDTGPDSSSDHTQDPDDPDSHV